MKFRNHKKDKIFPPKEILTYHKIKVCRIVPAEKKSPTMRVTTLRKKRIKKSRREKLKRG